MRGAIVLSHSRRVFLVGFSTAAVAILAPAASAAASPTCSTISPSIVKSVLGVTVYPGAGMGSSSFGGLKYLDCTYASGVSIDYISPATSSGWSSVMSMLKKATTTKSVSGLGSGAFSGTGSNTIVSTTAGSSKTKQTTVKTQNLWVYVSGKAIFEISINNGNLSHEEALAKKMVPLV